MAVTVADAVVVTDFVAAAVAVADTAAVGDALGQLMRAGLAHDGHEMHTDADVCDASELNVPAGHGAYDVTAVQS